MKERILKLYTVFFIGCLSYGLIEIAARGFSHITMGLLGGLSMIVIHMLNNQRRDGTNFIYLILIAAFFITSLELLSGEILNKIMELNIWNYSDVPFNFDGVICIPFTIIWIFMSFVAMVIDDIIRWKLFNEEKNFSYIKKNVKYAA